MYISALTLLTKKEHFPAVICCSAGKERTGILAALILHILGYSEQRMEREHMKCVVSI